LRDAGSSRDGCRAAFSGTDPLPPKAVTGSLGSHRRLSRLLKLRAVHAGVGLDCESVKEFLLLGENGTTLSIIASSQRVHPRFVMRRHLAYPKTSGLKKAQKAFPLRSSNPSCFSDRDLLGPTRKGRIGKVEVITHREVPGTGILCIKCQIGSLMRSTTDMDR